MSYFAHAFSKAFPVAAETGTSVATGAVLNNGFITNAGISTAALRGTSDDLVNAPFNSAVAPVFGLFGRDSYLSVDAASPEVVNGAPLILAGSSIMPNDKIGPFHGGYAESNKSKYINPRYVTDAYKFSAQNPQQSIWHIGVTNAQPGTTLDATTLVAGAGYPTDGTFTNLATTTGGAGTGMTVDIVVVGGVVTSIVENQVGSGYAIGDTITVDDDAVTGVPTTPAEIDILTVGTQDCEFTFLCGETYNLFINLSGTPVLRYLNHDSYRKLAAYTGCCPDDAIEPTPVDSTLVFIDWANQIIESPYLKEFIRPIVFDQAGNPWFATADEAIDAGWLATQIWSNYTSTGYVDGALGGIRLIGAFVDTQFDTCTFQTSDYFGKDFVKMDITLSDEEGDPCQFDGLCIFEECCGFNGQGFGDTYLKEIILNESYLQNNFSSDPRIREITQGNALRDVVDRYAFYDKYVIEHSVPRTNNPTSVHDNDKYRLMIYVPAGTDMSVFEGLIGRWLTNAGNHIGPEIDANGGFTEYGDRTPCDVTNLPTP